MGDTMQRRQFLSRLAKTNNTANPQTVEKSSAAIAHPPSSNRATGAQSGISLYGGAWTEKEMIHLLKRVMFGATKKDVDKIKGMSVSSAVDFLIDNPVQPDSPVNNYTIVGGTGATDTGGVAFGSSWIDAKLPDPTDATIRNTLNNNRLGNSFKPWWMGLMINQPTHILEKLTLFWSNHFGTDTANNNRPKAIYQHYKILRTYGLTNFKDLLKQVTIDPHMLYFLSGNNSSKPTPNENYARELQELFTVGKGTGSQYTEDDVKAAAKVLSGWQVPAQSTVDGTYTSIFTASRHDTTTKTFSAFYGPAPNNVIASNGINEVDDLLNMILKTNECAKYIVRRLYTWFVYYKITPDIEASVITPLADIFRSSNYSIPIVLKALFKSEHFFDSFNYGGIIKSPVDLYVSLVRELDLVLAPAPVETKYTHWKFFSDRCSTEAQSIGDPPNVAGWPAYYVAETKFYETWMSPATIQTKAKNLLSYSSKAGFKIGALTLKIDAAGFLKQFPVSDAGNADIAIKKFNLYLLPMDLTAEQITFLRAKLIPPGEPDNYWTQQWNNYLNSPSTNMAVAALLQDIVIYMTGLAEYYLY
ncbi:MAG: DUF1800 domain-containing protein [Chitinophagaceae bacterium]